MKQQYVLGFLFNWERDRVVLINKTKPDWQAGKLNGVGGKIEKDETPAFAMVREFQEETGVLTHSSHWIKVAVLQNQIAEMHVFAAVIDGALDRIRPTTDEVPATFKVPSVIYNPRIIPNLRWIIPICLNALDVTEWHPLDMPNGLR